MEFMWTEYGSNPRQLVWTFAAAVDKTPGHNADSCHCTNDFVAFTGEIEAEEVHVHQSFNYALHHALVCTINCVFVATYYPCVQAQLAANLKPHFSHYFAGGSEGLSHLKGLLVFKTTSRSRRSGSTTRVYR